MTADGKTKRIHEKAKVKFLFSIQIKSLKYVLLDQIAKVKLLLNLHLKLTNRTAQLSKHLQTHVAVNGPLYIFLENNTISDENHTVTAEE